MIVETCKSGANSVYTRGELTKVVGGELAIGWNLQLPNEVGSALSRLCGCGGWNKRYHIIVKEAFWRLPPDRSLQLTWGENLNGAQLSGIAIEGPHSGQQGFRKP